MKENTNRVSDFPFIRFPAALVKLPCFKSLSADAKLLYALIVDRFNLSIANKWRDENGTPYVYFSIDSVMESVGCAKAKAVKLMDTLEGVSFAEQNKGSASRIASMCSTRHCSTSSKIEPLYPQAHPQTSSVLIPVRKSNRSEIKPVYPQTSSILKLLYPQTSSKIKPVQTSSILRPVRLSNPRSLIFKPQKFGNRTLIRLSIIRLSLIRLKG